MTYFDFSFFWIVYVPQLLHLLIMAARTKIHNEIEYKSYNFFRAWIRPISEEGANPTCKNIIDESNTLSRWAITWCLKADKALIRKTKLTQHWQFSEKSWLASQVPTIEEDDIEKILFVLSLNASYKAFSQRSCETTVAAAAVITKM